MMLFAWTYQWVLLNPDRRPKANQRTLKYLVQLCNQLNPKQQLWLEMIWAEPINELY